MVKSPKKPAPAKATKAGKAAKVAKPRGAKPVTGGKRGPENRRQPLLDAAAVLFAERGYAGTSTRSVATASGMLPGSIYYHFPSKDALLLAVHEEGVRQTQVAVDAALATAGDDPWVRLQKVCEAHLETILGGSAYSRIVSPDFARALPAKMRRLLIAQRDAYEAQFSRVIDAIPLPEGVQRRYLRLALLGSLNWSLTWYHAGGDTPGVIAGRILDLYRLPLDTR